MITLALLASLLSAEADAAPVAVTPSSDVDDALAPRRIALLIGVQDYDDPALQGLRFPEKDAADLGRSLGAPGIGGFDRVFVVSGREATTKEALTRTLGLVSADLQRDDTFFLYFSGHGTLTLDASGSRLWLLPSDARLDQPERQGLAVADLEDFLGGLAPRRRVLVLDTCHNGRSGSKSSVNTPTAQLLSGFRGELPAPRSSRDVAESEARLYAAQYHQPAMEDPALQNGVYTHYLIGALTSGRGSADLDGDSLVDVTEAHEFARDHTISYTGGLQIPRAEYRIVGREEIYLAGNPSTRDSAERALISAYDDLLNRALILINGTPRGELPGVYAVEPGRSLIEVQAPDGRVLARRRVHLEGGERLAVEALVAERGSFWEVGTGAGYTLGDGSFNPIHGSAALWWVRPTPGPSWLRPDAHVYLDLGHGAVTDSTIPVTTGAATAGLTLATALGSGYFGPTAGVSVPFRARSDSPSQAGFAPVAGVAAGVTHTGATLLLDLRADVSWMGLSYSEERRSAWSFGLRLGFARLD